VRLVGRANDGQDERCKVRLITLIRILLLGMPQILRDLIRSIVDRQPDMRVIDEIDDDPQDLRRLGRSRAEFVIVGLRDSTFPDVCDQLLLDRPRTKIVGVSQEGRRAFLYELRPHTQQLGEMSSQVLLDVIRRGGAHVAGASG
jgi:DNA-binding NarL/FixJ family response regulator